jgi:hypothetical protein
VRAHTHTNVTIVLQRAGLIPSGKEDVALFNADSYGVFKNKQILKHMIALGKVKANIFSALAPNNHRYSMQTKSLREKNARKIILPFS